MNEEWFASAFSALYSGVPQVHGGDGGGGIVGLVEILLAKLTGLIESGAALVLFPGIRALAMNVHPLVVHFPIAFLSGYFLLDVVGVVSRRAGFRQAAGWMLYLGAFGAVAAAAAGWIAAANVPHGASVHEVMEWHQRLMLSVTGLALILATWRAVAAGRFASSMAQGLHLFLAVLMVTLMLLGTDLGGLMVYQHGVGVASLQQKEETSQHEHSTGAGEANEDAGRKSGAGRLVRHAH